MALALWLAYHPKNLEFAVVGSVIYNLTMFPTSQLLVTTMALTIVIRNPNKHSSIYYNQLIEMVLCKDQQIKSQIMLSPMISEKNTTVETSLEISGGAVSVAKELANEMVRSGSGFWLRLVLMGRVKWKL